MSKIKLSAMIQKRRKTRARKKANKHSACTSSYLECPTCGHEETIRAVQFDDKLAKSLSWAYNEYLRTGNTVVGVTLKSNPNVPDWVISDRSFSKLKYWGVIVAAGAGKYKLTDIGRIEQFLNGSTTRGAPRYMLVSNDQIVGKAEERITWAQAMQLEMTG